MSVIQEVVSGLIESSNNNERLGNVFAARGQRRMASELSEYADITEARAAGFATVEEMTRQMGRSVTETVADFLNAQDDKASDLNEIAQVCETDPFFAKRSTPDLGWEGDTVNYVSNHLAAINEVYESAKAAGYNVNLGVQGVAAFIAAQLAKAAKYDEIVEQFSGDSCFKTDWNGDAAWYAKELYEEFDRIHDAAKKHCDFGEDYMIAELADKVDEQLAEMAAIRQAIADTDAANNRLPARIPGDHATLAEFIGRLNTFVNDVVSAIEETAGNDPIRSDDDPKANSLKKASAYAVDAIKYTARSKAAYAEAAPIPIAELDKLVVEDGKIKRVPQSDTRKAVGYQGRPADGNLAAEPVSIRIHEELDDAPPLPTDAQQCTAHLLNYMDSKFKEQQKLHDDRFAASSGFLTRVNENVRHLGVNISIYAVLGFAAALVAFIVVRMSL